MRLFSPVQKSAMGKHPVEIFSSGKIHCSGQPVGLVVAETHELALRAADKVRIGYKNERKPVLTIREALKEPGRVTTDDCGPGFKVGEVDPFDEKLGEDQLSSTFLIK